MSITVSQKTAQRAYCPEITPTPHFVPYRNFSTELHSDSRKENATEA